MKHIINFASVLIILSGISACGKINDKSKPEIILTGESNIEIPQGVDTPDPGALATDDKDGNISWKITSDWNTRVNTDQVGYNMVTYSVKDKAGNEATAKRAVMIKYFAAGFYGEYTCRYTNEDYGPPSAPFNATISAGDNASQMVIYPFMGRPIYMKVNIDGAFGTSVNFGQTDFGITYAGTGIFENSGKTIKLSLMAIKADSSAMITQTLTRK